MGKPRFNIRRLNEKDIPEYSFMWRESRRINPDIFADSEDHDIQDIRRMIRAEIKAPDNKVIFAAESAGEIIGIGEFKRESAFNRLHRGHLSSVYVKESFRRRGVATKIVDAVIRYAGEQEGLEQLETAIGMRRRDDEAGYTDTARWQTAMCQKRGFIPYITHPSWMEFDGRYIDTMFMGLDLNTSKYGPPLLTNKKNSEADVSAATDGSAKFNDAPSARGKTVLPAPGAIFRLTGKYAHDYQWLRRESRRIHPDIFADSYEDEFRKSLDQLREEIKQKVIFAYILEGEIVGVAEYWREKDAHKNHRAHLAGMYVKESMRGKILGQSWESQRPPPKRTGKPLIKHSDPLLAGKTCASALVDKVISRARDDGILQLELAVVATNANAIKLYEKKGFVSIGAHQNWMRIVDEDLHVNFMVKKITGKSEPEKDDSK